MSAPALVIRSARVSARLTFVLDWLFKERLGCAYELIPDLAPGQPYRLETPQGRTTIPDAGFLWQKGTDPQCVVAGSWNGLFTVFSMPEADCTIPFDLFSGIFYLLSRYEEYGDFIPDRHERFPPSASILKEVLEQPVVDEWIALLDTMLRQQGLKTERSAYSFQASYDIDIAWSYRGKGWKRWAGAAFKELLSGRLNSFLDRCRVLSGATDPYDSFEWLGKLHARYGIKPLYFILLAARASDYDKNISPRRESMRQLAAALSAEGLAGIHPSYYTKDNPELLKAEKQLLERMTQQEATISRQHYIRLFFPGTYRMLQDAGIREDFSMGYSTALGFRAGTSFSFPWYDLKREQVTGLRITPFCFMDTTARFDLGLGAAAAFDRLYGLQQRLKACNGRLVTIFHNFSLGTDPGWEGWRSRYEQLVAGAGS